MTIRFPCVPGTLLASRPPSSAFTGQLPPRIIGPLGARPAGHSNASATALATSPEGLDFAPEPASIGPTVTAASSATGAPREGRAFGRIILRDYETCEAKYPGAIFAMSVTAQDEVEFFSHAPYERYGATEHAKLSPMFFEATLRGRLEPDEEKRPTLTLKAPQSVREYFEFKNVPEQEWSSAIFGRMVRDEYIRVARKLLDTGMPGDTVVLIDRLQEFFPDERDLADAEPFSLNLLASRDVGREQ